MAKYFLQDTPLAELERMMTQIPRPGKRSDNVEHDTAQRRQRQNPKQEQPTLGGAEAGENMIQPPRCHI
jgi:hypothetical protein